MKKLILIGIGLAGAAAFIGFDAVHAFVDKTRTSVRATLMSPEMELQGQLAEAKSLAGRCAESIEKGGMAMARLDALISERERDVARRTRQLSYDRHVLESRQELLGQKRSVYLIGHEEVTARTLNRDAVLRAKAFSSDREIVDRLKETLRQLKVQQAQTAVEIEEATVEQRRLESEVTSLKAELENLKARKAVAQTRKEASYVFDRSTFDKARDKISEIRANIAVQNKQIDFYGRLGRSHKGLIPADAMPPSENGAEAIAAVLGEKAEAEEDEEESETLAAVRR